MAKQLLMGNEAFAHAALEAGVRVVAGYPGTPSSELIETVARLHATGAARGVHVEWSTNEKSALELLAGASYAGARCLFTCKQVGLNVASDALMSLNYVGVKGGLVLFVADDPGPISSQTEQDTRRFGMFAKIPVLDPATPEQGFAMIQAAFELSERYRTPVIVRPTTRINHASTFFEVAASTEAMPVPEEGFVRDPKWIIFPKRAFQGHGEINDRLRAIANDFSTEPLLAACNPVFEGGRSDARLSDCAKRSTPLTVTMQFSELQTNVSRETFENEKITSSLSAAIAASSSNQATNQATSPAADLAANSPIGGPRLGIMTGGVSTAYAREALRTIEAQALAAGVAVPAYRFMQVGTPYPFPQEAVAAFVEGLDHVLVLEELDHVLEDELLAFCGATHGFFNVRGKLTGDARDRGENDVDDIACRIARFVNLDEARLVGDFAAAKACASGNSRLPEKACLPVLPVRPPVLCAGCPHRGSFYAIKQALGKTPAVLCGDIGCYTLGNAQPLDAIDTCLCMGAGITMAQGFRVVEPHKKQVAFVGDSTFFASGLPGIVNAVYNGHDITVCVVDNATTAMTGSQPHPGTGVTLMGPKRKPLSIKAMLQAMGVECIVQANPLDLDASIEAAREALAFEGPSALVFESPCVQLIPPDLPALIDSELCTGCKKCITEIGCPGIGFDVDLEGSRSRGRGQAFVDASLCNGCGLCTHVCPFEALSTPEGGSHA